MDYSDSDYIVTEIKEITSKRRLIYINYEPAFALYPAEIRRYHIVKDKVLLSESYSEIVNELLTKRAKIRAMNLLKSKDYTTSELTHKLKLNYYPVAAIDSAVEYVTSYGYLNDIRFAESYVAFKADTKSRKQIEQFLYNKGLSKDIIKLSCDQYYEANSDVELNQAVRQLEKKLSGCVEIDYTERQKLCAYLYRHGFSIDTVRKALDIVVAGTFE